MRLHTDCLREAGTDFFLLSLENKSVPVFVISSGISTAINGGSFSSNLGSALINEGLDLAAAAGNKGVGDLAEALHVEPGTATTMLLHATLGGLLSVAKGQDFTSGAIAGGVADGLTPIANGLLAQYASDQFSASDLSQEGSQKKIATAQIIGLLAASLAGGDPSTGSMIGGAAEKYNDESHLEKKIRSVLALLSGSQTNAGFENQVAAQDPVAEFDGMGFPVDRSSGKTPANQILLMSVLLMAGVAPEFLPELLGGSTEGAAASLPRAGGLFSEIGEGSSVDAGAGAGNTAATSEGGVDTAASARGEVSGRINGGRPDIEGDPYNPETVDQRSQINKDLYGSENLGPSDPRWLEIKQGQVAELRSTLTGKLRTEGNVAVADVHIEGLPGSMAAHSGIDEVTGDFIGEASRSFDSQILNNAKGAPIDRATDAEYKILDNISDMLAGNKGASGTVDIFSELKVCASCSEAIAQFKARFPNIDVNVVANPNGLRVPVK